MKRLEINYSLKSMDVLVSLARYNFVIKTINNADLKVLDFGCGSGYGTRVLKERFNDVSSFDMYPDDYRPEGIDVNTDLNSIPRNNFDLITCFEVIEHMDEVAQNKLMDDLCSLLNDQGTLYISTVRKMDPPPTKNRQVEHIKELSFDELYKVCSERFHNVYTFGQVDQTISTFNIENQYHFVFICSGRK